MICALSASLLLCCAANGRADDRQLAEQLIQKLYEGRSQLKLAELDWTVEVVENKKSPSLVGCTYKYHAWYDHLDDRLRVDLDQNCPLDAALTLRSRFAYSGQRYLIVDSEKMAGHEMESLGPEFMRDPSPYATYRLSTDPRLLGVFPARFATLKNYTLDDILWVFHKAQNYEVSEEEVDGRSMTILRFIGYDGVDCNITYWLDHGAGNMPFRIVSEVESDVRFSRREIQTEWRPFESRSEATSAVWLPVESVARRWTDDELKTHETYVLHQAVIGQRPDDKLFTWKGLNLPDKFVVVHKSGKEKHIKQWNAELQVFGEWEPKPLVPIDAPGQAWPTSESRARRTKLLVFGNLAAAIVLFAYVFIRWRAKQGSVKR